MNILILLLSVFFIGWFSNILSLRISNYLKSQKIINDSNSKFKQVLDNIKSNKALFKSRVNHTIYISTSIIDYGLIDIVYLIDKKDIALFKNDNCIYTTHVTDKKIIDDIILSIRTKFNSQINDVVQVMGITISKEEFEKSFNVNISDIKKQQKMIQNEQKSDIEKIIENNNKKLSIDDILDKIGKIGYDNLSPNEKEFLKKNSN
jgi:hypothetical protein